MFLYDVEKVALENTYFRHVIYTRVHSQLILMSLLPHEDIGMETHFRSDQILYIVKGEGSATINGEEQHIAARSIVFVPAGAEHNIVNDGNDSMKLFTVYAPPIHADGIIHKTKSDAKKEEL